MARECSRNAIAGILSKKESFPSKQEFLDVLDDAVSLLGSGLVNLPDPTLKQFVDSLTAAKAAIQALP